MKHLVITKKSIKKIERKLLKVIQKEYANKEMYVATRIDVSYYDNECDGYINIRYGKYEADGTVDFQYTTKIYLHSLNPNFIAGQFLENFLRDEDEARGDCIS